MKNILLIIVSFLIIIPASAQRILKYKDVYERVLSGEREEIYSLLLTYQKQDPEFANTYYQLGLIADSWAREYDPLTEYDYVKSFIYDTKLYYGLALLKLKEEKKRYRNFYINGNEQFTDEKFEIKDIELFVQMKKNEIEDYEEKISEIVNYFNKSSDSYNKCLSIFKDINEDYTKIKNIWISNDPDLMKQLDLLQKNFDTTLTAFDKYRTALRKFPIKNYNQSYYLANIYTYRLHGLTPANFLSDKITLWDYNSWVEQIRNVHSSSINTLRRKIEKEQQLSDSVINALEKGKITNSENQKEYSIPSTLLFQIEKIDYQSVITYLFKARAAYIEFLTLQTQSLDESEISGDAAIKQIALHYKRLIEENQKTKAAINEFKKNINAEKIVKHKDFLLKYYSGLSGMREYAEALSVSLNDRTYAALTEYGKLLDANLQKAFPEDLKYHNKPIFYPGENYKLSALKKNAYYVSNYMYAADQKCTFTGFHFDTAEKLTPFFAQIDTAGEITYFKHYTTPDYRGMTGSHIRDFDKGKLIVFQKNENNSHSSKLIKIDDKANVITTSNLAFDKEISNLEYDDINNIAEIIFRSFDGRLQYVKYDLKSNNSLFECDLNAWGEFFDFIRSEKNNLLFINYRTIIDANGKSIKALPANNKNARDIALLVINDNGKITDKRLYPFDANYEGRAAIKIDSKTINLSGIETDTRGKTVKGSGLYILLDENGNITWQNRHN